MRRICPTADAIQKARREQLETAAIEAAVLENRPGANVTFRPVTEDEIRPLLETNG